MSIRSRYEHFQEKPPVHVPPTTNAGVGTIPASVSLRDRNDPQSLFNIRKREAEVEAAEKQRRIDAEAAEVAERRRIGEERNKQLLQEEAARKEREAKAAQARRKTLAEEAGQRLDIDAACELIKGYDIPASKRIVEISKEMGLGGTALGVELAIVRYQREQAAESQKMAILQHKAALRKGLVSKNPQTGEYEKINTPLPDDPPIYKAVEEE